MFRETAMLIAQRKDRRISYACDSGEAGWTNRSNSECL